VRTVSFETLRIGREGPFFTRIREGKEPFMNRPMTVLKLSRRIADDIVYATSIHDAMAKSPWFPDPAVPLDVLEQHIQDVKAASASALMRTRGLATERKAKFAIVLADLRHLQAYVQLVADDNPENAASIIESAGMSVKNARGRGKNLFRVVRGPTAGSVILTTEWAGDRASYEAAWSLDEESWTSLGEVLQSKRVVTGLPSRRRLFFRARAVTKNGPGNGSDVVSLVLQ
jgi:hypothetical protein